VNGITKECLILVVFCSGAALQGSAQGALGECCMIKSAVIIFKGVV